MDIVIPTVSGLQQLSEKTNTAEQSTNNSESNASTSYFRFREKLKIKNTLSDDLLYALFEARREADRAGEHLIAGLIVEMIREIAIKANNSRAR